MAEKSWFTSRPQPSPLLHCVDRRGCSIHPDVLRIARSIVPRAIPFAEQLINDAALATSLLEESAASVSRVVRMRSQVGKAAIVHLEAYLFRAFIRRVNLARSREVLVATAISSGALSRDGAGCSEQLELRVLLDEFITRCDPVTRDMLFRRIQGLSWKEIGKLYGISAHAAEARFSQRFQKIRKRLGFR